jgi:hypothetical protein
MPSDRRIKIMISSRCKDKIDLDGKQVEMTALRRAIKQRVTAIEPFGAPFFECWINEDSPAIGGASTSWDACLQQVRRADVLLVLYNGNPGWAKEAGGIGICHAELQTGLSTGAAKVVAIELPDCALPTDPGEASRYSRFRAYYALQDRFVSKVKNGDEALAAVPDVLHEALAELVSLGGREARKGRFDTGDALGWSRLDFADRKAAMEEVVRESLAARKGSKEDSGSLYVRVGGADLLFLIHAVPDALTNAAAREMVGRPFHHDHEAAPALGRGKGGPVHVIACHRGVTEKQASDLLGQPDVETVDAAFGVLAVDRSSKVQCIFLRNCRDETSTRHAAQRAFEWLERSEEDLLVARRGASRARIVKTIAEENAGA